MNWLFRFSIPPVTGKLLACAALVCGLGFSPAQAQHADIFLTRQGTKLVTGAYGDNPIAGARVFGFELLEEDANPNNPYFSLSEPGIRAPSSQTTIDAHNPPAGAYQMLPSSAALNFHFRAFGIQGGPSSNLFYWDGIDNGAPGYADDIQFTPVSAGDNVIFSWRTGGNLASVTGAATDAIGYSPGSTGSDGSLHLHSIDVQLGKAGATPDAGMYLLAVEFSLPGLENSLPTYVVYNVDGDELAHDYAIDWVNTNVAAVPEPSALAIAGMGAAVALLAALRRRRSAVR